MNDDDFFCILAPALWYHASRCEKQPCRTASLSGQEWLDEVILGNVRRFQEIFRMLPTTFRSILDLLVSEGDLKSSANVTVEEKFATVYS